MLRRAERSLLHRCQILQEVAEVLWLSPFRCFSSSFGCQLIQELDEMFQPLALQRSEI